VKEVRVIGGGLAGCEASLQLAKAGLKVLLFEMKPHKKTPAQKLDGLAELVCSNSFRSNQTANAVGLLKDEMLVLKGELLPLALKAQVPAGDSLAVDRQVFSALVEGRIAQEKNIVLIKEEVTTLPVDDTPTILATGPLTSPALSQSLVDFIGAERLAFYDAISPIIEADSIDMTKAFIQSRWQAGTTGGDYINCPLNQEEYQSFIGELKTAQQFKAHDFEEAQYFEGCLPIEVMAARGDETLRYGPFKPVGLFNPHSDERPHAVLQLRKEDVFGQSYNLVGCQTRMTIPEQKRVFGLIPALAEAKYLRFGSVHRNTYVDSPRVLDSSLRLKDQQGRSSNIYLAGQITGVEGYVESIAAGIIVATILIDYLNQKPLRIFPAETAHGGLYRHILGLNLADAARSHVPSNVTWAMIPPLLGKKKQRAARRQALYERAILHMKAFVAGECSTSEDELNL
jgi:methylenetetrahydrofolate--tRNA-(uracil-5-)-methyltransferase